MPLAVHLELLGCHRRKLWALRRVAQGAPAAQAGSALDPHGTGAPWLVVNQPPGSEGTPIPSGPSRQRVPRGEAGDLVPWIGKGTDPPRTARVAGPPGIAWVRRSIAWPLPASMGQERPGSCPSDSRCTARIDRIPTPAAAAFTSPPATWRRLPARRCRDRCRRCPSAGRDAR